MGFLDYMLMFLCFYKATWLNHNNTGGEPLFTQWVRGGFIVGSETKYPAWTHQVHFDYFYDLPAHLPSMGPPGTW